MVVAIVAVVVVGIVVVGVVDVAAVVAAVVVTGIAVTAIVVGGAGEVSEADVGTDSTDAGVDVGEDDVSEHDEAAIAITATAAASPATRATGRIGRCTVPV